LSKIEVSVVLNELPRHENFWRGDGLPSRVLHLGKRGRQVIDIQPLLVLPDRRENLHVRIGQLAWWIPNMYSTIWRIDTTVLLPGIKLCLPGFSDRRLVALLTKVHELFLI
jgi:hypothetical protein